MRNYLKVLIALFFVIPANAESKRDVYPLSCDALWTAIKATLDNPRDYGILSVNDLNLHASFIVVGSLVQYTDRITLSEQSNGCKMKLRMLQVGPDNSDERGFRKRLKRSLAKVETAKSGSAGDSKPEALMGQQ